MAYQLVTIQMTRVTFKVIHASPTASLFKYDFLYSCCSSLQLTRFQLKVHRGLSELLFSRLELYIVCVHVLKVDNHLNCNWHGVAIPRVGLVWRLLTHSTLSEFTYVVHRVLQVKICP